jgi:hypothetical protein
VTSDIVITANGFANGTKALGTPNISVNGHILSIDDVYGADEYMVFSNGVHILTVEKDGTVTVV